MDSGVDAAPDASDASTDASTDTGVSDAGGPTGCSVDYATELALVGQTTDVTVQPYIRTDRSDTALLAIFADDRDGPLGIRIATTAVDGAAGISRSDLAGAPEGASHPDIARVQDSWLVSFATAAGEIFVEHLSDDLTPVGAAVRIATSGAQPALSRLGTGAILVWNEGTTLKGQVLAADGTAVGTTTDIGTLPTADTPFDVHSYGTTGGALVVIGSTAGTPAHATGYPIASPGTGSATSTELGSTAETEGVVRSAQATPMAPSMLEPLLGAATFDVRVGGTFGEIRFVLLDAGGARHLDEFTVSERGESSWGSSVTDYGDGYAVAYRARPRDGAFSRVRVGFMARDSCRLGSVDSWMTAGMVASEQGSGTEITASGTSLLVAWAETLTDAVNYHVAVIRCRSM